MFYPAYPQQRPRQSSPSQCSCHCGALALMEEVRDVSNLRTNHAMSTVASVRSVHLPGLDDEYVCWSRMQAEAGQGLHTIVARKEQERLAGNGNFFWGVGNAPALIASVLARSRHPVKAVFSVMKSRPKAVDVAPEGVVAWRRYIDATGVERPLPPHALVTSRAEGAAGPKKMHFALMCHCEDRLALVTGGETFDPSAYRNAGGTGAPVGNSQVTALLRRVSPDSNSADYEVNLTAWLSGSYWVRLTDPVELSDEKRSLIDRLGTEVASDWNSVVGYIRQGASSYATEQQGSLL